MGLGGTQILNPNSSRCAWHLSRATTRLLCLNAQLYTVPHQVMSTKAHTVMLHETLLHTKNTSGQTTLDCLLSVLCFSALSAVYVDVLPVMLRSLCALLLPAVALACLSKWWPILTPIFKLCPLWSACLYQIVYWSSPVHGHRQQVALPNFKLSSLEPAVLYCIVCCSSSVHCHTRQVSLPRSKLCPLLSAFWY